MSPRQDSFDKNPDNGHGDQHLPAQPHDLVIAVAREGGAEPQEQKQEQKRLQRQPAEAGRRQDGMAQHRPALEGTQPPADEEHRRQEGDQQHVGVFGQEEQRKGDARVLDMEAGDDLGFAFGHVKGRAIGLGNAGNEVHDEQRKQPGPVPGEQAPLLVPHDVAQVQAARGHEYSDQRKAHCDLVGHDLRSRPHGAQEGILGVGRPARQNHPVHTGRRQRQQEQQARIDVGDDQIRRQRHHRPGGERRHQGDAGRQREHEFVGLGRNDHFLGDQLDDVGERLTQTREHPQYGHAIGSAAQLHPADDLALPQRGQGHHDDQGDGHRHDPQGGDRRGARYVRKRGPVGCQSVQNVRALASGSVDRGRTAPLGGALQRGRAPHHGIDLVHGYIHRAGRRGGATHRV